MGKTLTIQPVSRIEGHAKVTIQLDDSGNVSDTRVHVIELRGFEQFPDMRSLPLVTSFSFRKNNGCCFWRGHSICCKKTKRVM